jgi:hypothetical protein
LILLILLLFFWNNQLHVPVDCVWSGRGFGDHLVEDAASAGVKKAAAVERGERDAGLQGVALSHTSAVVVTRARNVNL